MALCPGCGNEVPDPTQCPVCKAGRGGRKEDKARCKCPRCQDPLQQQDWEGTATLSCPTCRGAFFPGRSLETVLNKLRANCDPVDMDAVLKEFKDRFTRELPEAVRYKACPVCETVMIRRNYATVSGVIVDYCGDHGIWVDENAFAELADFIVRGGDIVAQKAQSVRARAASTGPVKDKARSGGIIDRLLGS